MTKLLNQALEQFLIKEEGKVECQCGKYAVELTTLPDGTKIYYCYECHRIWGERLVRFDVTFDLREVISGPTIETISAPAVPSSNGSSEPTSSQV